MKTLITTLGVLFLSLAPLAGKESTITSVILRETDSALRFDLKARQWIKITNFIQNNNADAPAARAGVAVYQGSAALWVLFATDPNVSDVPHKDVFIAGPATVTVSPSAGATVFLTYQRGSD